MTSPASPDTPGHPPAAPPLRIIHLITGLRIGGAERMLEKLVTGMAPAAADSIVVSLTGEGPIGARLRDHGITVHALDIDGALGLPAGLLRLRRILRQQRPHIIQTWLYHADLVGLLATVLFRSNARLLWNLRCSDMDLAEYRLPTRLIRRLLAWLSAQPDLIVSNSRAGQIYHEKIGYHPRRWTIIPNGFDLDLFQADAEAAPQLRRSLGLPPTARLAGMIARFDPMKDHATFLAMAERLLDDRPDLHFLLVGRGCTSATPVLAAGADRLRGHLHLLGERSDIPAILAGLDLVVLSSAYGEGFPNVLGEALATGTPCAATDVGDVAAIVGDCGLVVPPRAPDALAAAAGRLLDLPEPERAALRAKTRHRAETHFALPAIISRYETLYREIAPQE